MTHQNNIVYKLSCIGSHRSSVDDVAFLPDLAVGTGEHADLSHALDGVLECVEEDARVLQLVDDVGGAAVGEQRGVGGEHALVRLEVDEVVVVEGEAAAGVHGHHRGVVVGVLQVAPALPLEESGVGWVEGGVDVAGVVLAGEVEQPRAEEVAMPDADRVPACCLFVVGAGSTHISPWRQLSSSNNKISQSIFLKK